jgi:hypothetical protein
VPSERTFRRVLSRLDSDALDAAVGGWVADVTRGTAPAPVVPHSPAFLYRLAASYGTSGVAVRVTGTETSGPAPREADTSPFWGGASGCTSGFAWHSGSVEMMVSAGHCYPNGYSNVSTPVQSMGSVTQSSEENWTSGTGTVLLTGQSVYRGDLSLVRIFSGKSSYSRIYRGGYNSSTYGDVAGKMSRSPANGDQYCTGGP